MCFCYTQVSLYFAQNQINFSVWSFVQEDNSSGISL